MIRECEIAPRILEALYDPHGPGAGGAIVVLQGLSGESGDTMSELPILDPDWQPASVSEARDALSLIREVGQRVEDWINGVKRTRPPAPNDPAWTAFLSGHSELEGKMYPWGGGWWCFNDRNEPDYERIEGALRHISVTKPEGATSLDVAQRLWGTDALAEESRLIGQRLHNMTVGNCGAPVAVRKISKGHYLPLEVESDA